MDFNEQFAIELKYLSVVLPEKKLKIYKEKIYRVFEFFIQGNEEFIVFNFKFDQIKLRSYDIDPLSTTMERVATHLCLVKSKNCLTFRFFFPVN